MLANKKLSMGMTAFAMLLSQTESVSLHDCCGGSCCGGNEANIDLNFEVNVASAIR